MRLSILGYIIQIERKPKFCNRIRENYDNIFREICPEIKANEDRRKQLSIDRDLYGVSYERQYLHSPPQRIDPTKVIVKE